MLDIWTRLLPTLEAAALSVFCRLIETRGSTPQPAGATMLVFPDGQTI